MSTARELLARTDLRPRDFAIVGLAPIGGLTWLGGPEKSCKSWLADEFALAVTDGKPACDHWTIPAVGDVLLLANEEDDGGVRDRLVQLYAARGTEPSDRLHIDTEWPEADAGGLAKLDDWLRDHPDARLVVLDIMRKFLPLGSPYSHHVDARKVDRLNELAKRHSVAILGVGHMDKGSKPTDPNWRDRFQGSKGITAAAHAIIGLWRPDDGPDGVLRVAGRLGVRSDTVAMQFSEETGVWLAAEPAGELAADEALSPARTAILDALTEHGGGMQRREITAATAADSNATGVLLHKMRHTKPPQVVRDDDGLYWIPAQLAFEQRCAEENATAELPLPLDAPASRPLPPTAAELHVRPAAVRERAEARAAAVLAAAAEAAARSLPRRRR